MPNTYYQYRNNIGDLISQMSLTSIDGDSNDIQLSICMGIEKNGIHSSAIRLTEQEQDDLIAGILERRGMGRTQNSADWIKFTSGYGGISPDDATQSKIHPANPKANTGDVQW